LGRQSKKFKIKAHEIPKNAAYLEVREIPGGKSATPILDFLRSRQVCRRNKKDDRAATGRTITLFAIASATLKI